MCRLMYAPLALPMKKTKSVVAPCNIRIAAPLSTYGPPTARSRWTTNVHHWDYEHYLTRQLQPVAEGILPFIEDNFATLMTGQLGLF
ncbi:DNA polymerase II [Escherichia coli]|uniref:DNA-directed DNA polymerase n=1 Tax=Escherichia coli TaxID=562 RepID=A0A2X1PZT3_ECOLX|nr:DNA polymerase II [Escherichia coli]